MPLKKDYQSPRWTQEILDCSMPMTFDTYSRCSYNCMYCFSFFQKSHCCTGYLDGKVRSVNPEKIKAMFTNILSGNYAKLSNQDRQFIPYVRDRKVMQWGALADQFDQYEKRFGVTLDLLRYFDQIDYPLSFSSKAAWYTEDERYMSLIRRHPHNWHFKVSIITLDRKKAAQVERGVPSPEARLQAIKRLSDAGCHVTLRLRPYIIGVSDDWRQLIQAGKEAGADSVTTEFFCMETRADENLRKRYEKIASAAGYDIYKFYKGNSPQNGYKRLSEGIKRPIITAMRDLSHSLGMRFHVSDAYCRDLNDAPNCCGVPPEWKCNTCHFGGAILKAKAQGEVRYADIKPGVDHLFGNFMWYKACQFNTTSNRKRAIMNYASMADWFRISWNKPESGSSPMKMYGKLLRPKGKDTEGNIIYEYIGPK